MARKEQSAFPGLIALALLTGVLGLEAPALGASTWTVHVGRGGAHFVDDVSGTSVTTIAVGDTVTWVWEGSMEHSVTSGTCPDDHGGGGGGGGYGGVYGGGCTANAAWQESGLHADGFSFSQTFLTAGTVNYFCDMHQSAMTGKVVVQAAAATGPCVPGEHTLCLDGGRYSVTTHWSKSDGTEGEGTQVKLTDDSGYFWFFDSTNIEATVKVLNGCGINSSHWVFAAGLTDVGVHLTVTDTASGAVYTRDNPQGQAFVPIQDVGAFPASCP
jgi:plastocyanin